MKRILAFLALASCAIAGTWVASPGKGSHAAAGGASVTIDASSKATFTGTVVGSFTFTIDVSSHSNRCLMVAPMGASGVDAPHRVIDSVSSSLDGALTQVTSSAVTDTVFMGISWWYILNPTVGTHTITVVVQAGESIVSWFGTAISLYNVSQSTPFGTAATSSSTSTASGSASGTLASTDMLVGNIASDANSTLTISTGTEQQKTTGLNSDVCVALATNTGSGSVSIAFSGTAPDNGWVISVVPVKSP